jgi:hypothetical protein
MFVGRKDEPDVSGKPQRGKHAATKVLRVRLTSEEWARLERLAAKAGQSLSEYVRAKSLGVTC